MCTLFRLILIDLQNVGVISAALCITFLLTPCEAGAMPLAVFITSGQQQADYETSFNWLKRAVEENLFGGQHYPKCSLLMTRTRIFMTCHIFYLTSFSMPKLISTRF